MEQGANNCPRCGGRLVGGAKNCLHCGALVAPGKSTGAGNSGDDDGISIVLVAIVLFVIIGGILFFLIGPGGHQAMKEPVKFGDQQ